MQTNDNEQKAAESQSRSPAPVAPAKQKSELPDQIPEFPGDGSSGKPG